MAAEPHPVLYYAEPGKFVGVRLSCPRYNCDWREDYGSAIVVNKYGVKDPMPSRCGKCGLGVKVDEIVEVIGAA